MSTRATPSGIDGIDLLVAPGGFGFASAKDAGARTAGAGTATNANAGGGSMGAYENDAP